MIPLSFNHWLLAPKSHPFLPAPIAKPSRTTYIVYPAFAKRAALDYEKSVFVNRAPQKNFKGDYGQVTFVIGNALIDGNEAQRWNDWNLWNFLLPLPPLRRVILTANSQYSYER